MSDAICGPSNPLQTFSKQTNVDRTLQQDRVAGNRHLEQGFRSISGANAGILDAEFEAFQAGQPYAVVDTVNQQFASGASATYPNVQSPTRGTSSWTADFQSLRLIEASASPIPEAQFRHQAPVQHTAPEGWHQDFMRQYTQATPSHASQQRSHQGDRVQGSFAGNFGKIYSYPGHKQPELHNGLQYEQMDMERAFDEVALEQIETQKFPPTIHLSREIFDMHPAEEIRIGSDTISDRSAQNEEKNTDIDDADELAKTAGQLLDNVKHDQSQKFKDSNFLSLMRQIRDREVHVEGDQLVDTMQPLHPGGILYPIGGSGPVVSSEDTLDEGLSAMKLA